MSRVESAAAHSKLLSDELCSSTVNNDTPRNERIRQNTYLVTDVAAVALKADRSTQVNLMGDRRVNANRAKYMRPFNKQKRAPRSVPCRSG